jgi:3-deoxy-7-phosphoheptulonate synthase
MLIIMDTTAGPDLVRRVCDEIEKMGLASHPIVGMQRTVIAVTGNKFQIDSDHIQTMPGVNEIVHVTRPYRLVSRDEHPEDSVFQLNGVTIGGGTFTVMAGPCSVESRDQAFRIAEAVAKAGAKVYRGGAFKPRTSPYTFQGLGEEGLQILREVREQFGLLIITEAIDTETLDLVAQYADIVQIGARNMQNYSLLRKAGRTNKPVLVKRGLSATIDEWLMAAEYVLAEGNPRVILCERGIRTSANHNGHVLDLSAIPHVKRLSHLPVICDPSHGSGQKYKVPPLSRASLAAGADGLLIEVHHEPQQALSDGPQAITPDILSELMNDVRNIAGVLGRTIA